MLATTCPSSMRSRRRLPPSRRALRRWNARPANRVAGQKTAPGIFFAAPPETRPEIATQTLGTHQETWVWAYDFASGCAVAPNSTLAGNVVGSPNAQTGGYQQQVTWHAPAGFNGLIVQQVTAKYRVTDAKGNWVRATGDTRINGAMTYSYYEAWTVVNGVVGVKLNGQFFGSGDAAKDTFVLTGWGNNVANGQVTLNAQAHLIPGGTAEGINWYQDTSSNPTSASGNLPIWNSIGAPPGFNSSGGVTRDVTITYNPQTKQWDTTTSSGGHWP